MNKKNTGEPDSTATVPSNTSTNAEGAYDSNPFTSGWSAIQKLFHINPHAMIGLAFFNILLFVLLFIIGVVIFFAIIGLVHKSNPQLVFPVGLIDLTMFDSFTAGALNAILIGDIVLLVLIGLLIQVLQAQLALVSAKEIAIKFGRILKESLRHMLPVLGFGALGLLAIICLLMIFSVFAQLMGFAAVVPFFILLAVGVYISLRISFTVYAILDENIGPIKAIKRSWVITKGHVIESVGSASVAWLILAVPSVALSALARLTAGSPGVSQVFDLLGTIIAVVLVVIAAMPLAERFVQLQAVADKKITPTNLSPLNYVALLLVLLVGPLLSSLSPQNTTMNPLTPEYNTSTQNNPLLPAKDLPTSLQ